MVQFPDICRWASERVSERSYRFQIRAHHAGRDGLVLAAIDPQGRVPDAAAEVSLRQPGKQASGLSVLYRVSHPAVHLGWVGFGCSTMLPRCLTTFAKFSQPRAEFGS